MTTPWPIKPCIKCGSTAQAIGPDGACRDWRACQARQQLAEGARRLTEKGYTPLDVIWCAILVAAAFKPLFEELGAPAEFPVIDRPAGLRYMDEVTR